MAEQLIGTVGNLANVKCNVGRFLYHMLVESDLKVQRKDLAMNTRLGGMTLFIDHLRVMVCECSAYLALSSLHSLSTYEIELSFRENFGCDRHRFFFISNSLPFISKHHPSTAKTSGYMQ